MTETSGEPPLADDNGATRAVEPQASPGRRMVYGWAALALLLGLALTALAWRQQMQRRRADWVADQQVLADQSYAALDEQLDSAERLLRAVQSLYMSSDTVTGTEFADMYANLRPRKRFPSMEALAYAQRQARSDGVHYVTVEVAPMHGNEAVQGLDVVSQPANLAGLLRSVDTDQPALSAPFRLVQQRGTVTPTDGVTLRLPIYSPGPAPQTLAQRRARARGSVAVSFRVGGLIGDALPKQALAKLHVHIGDVTGGGLLPLYDSQPGSVVPAKGLDFSRTLHYGGRTWRVQMRTLESASPMPWLQSALPAGVVASILLALLVFSVANTRQRAMALASRMSRRYRDSERRLRALNEQQRLLNERLSHQASHDALTGLYNRREFEQRLQQTLTATVAGASKSLLLYIDLDQFKLINDTSGHLAGDELLVQLAACLRRQLGPDDVLARIGGDEFGVLATGLGDREAADAVAERVRQAIDTHVFNWENHSHRISASIGAVLLDQSGLTMKNLLAQADAACYEVKDLGRNDIHFYSEHDGQATRRREEMQWADRLRRAINEDRLVLVYQEIRPLRATPTGSKVELLVRYRGEDGQLVTPGAFMSAAEHYGLMPALDRWVGHAALAHFDRLHPDGAKLGMAAINLSGASIEDQRHADQIVDLLRRYGVEPARVCFEITETMAVRNIERVAAFIAPLRAAGCKVALDDFGAGMSSFAYLKNLSVDIIKIDGSFVRDLLTDPVSQAMVRAVADIGKQRGLVVVAEWVSDDATIEALAELGVQYGQGFKLHIPEVTLYQRG